MRSSLGLFLLLAAFSLWATDLTRDEIKLLQDPGGWEYLKMTSGGIQTEHPCFDGKLHPETCSGRLTLKTGGTFTQAVTISGQQVPRHGTYTLEGGQLTFFDEFQTADGPYTVELNAAEKKLAIYTSQVRIELILEKALREKKRKGEK